eukprot:g12696.t1
MPASFFTNTPPAPVPVPVAGAGLPKSQDQTRASMSKPHQFQHQSETRSFSVGAESEAIRCVSVFSSARTAPDWIASVKSVDLADTPERRTCLDLIAEKLAGGVAMWAS